MEKGRKFFVLRSDVVGGSYVSQVENKWGSILVARECHHGFNIVRDLLELIGIVIVYVFVIELTGYFVYIFDFAHVWLPLLIKNSIEKQYARVALELCVVKQ